MIQIIAGEPSRFDHRVGDTRYRQVERGLLTVSGMTDGNRSDASRTQREVQHEGVQSETTTNA